LKEKLVPDAGEIFANPHWVPHHYDAQEQKVQFVHLDRDEIRGLTFLADYQPQKPHNSYWMAANALEPENIAAGQLHFIFHSAFVRSTLLTRALDIPGKCLGLSEPGILNELAAAGPKALPIMAPVLQLLSRPFGPGEVMVIKPSNAANSLIPAMLSARRDARALLLTGSVENFLRSVHKKGMMGRRWARRLYSHLMQYAPIDLGMSKVDQFEATDLQYAGLAWFLQQRQFAMLLSSGERQRLRSLDSDRFNQERTKTLASLSDLFGIDAKADEVSAVVDGPLFTTHAKLGGDFEAQIESEEKAAQSGVVEQEVAMVAQWVDQISKAAGISWPLARSL
jgi:hypothetical protein